MTSPTSGNDDIVKVVYEAVADFSQLLRETRRARTEVQALKRDVDQLAGQRTARVKVTADTAAARAEIARVLQDMVVKARVVADTAAARADIARTLRDLTVKARVVLDAVAARSELALFLRDTALRVRLVLDAAAARVQLAEVTRGLVARVRVETDAAGLAGLAAQLSRIRDLTVRAGVVVDDRALTALRAQLGKLRDVQVRVIAAVDAGSVAGLRAQLGQLRDVIVRATVAADTAGLARLRVQLARLRDVTVRVRVDTDTSLLDRIEKTLDRLRAAPTGATGSRLLRFLAPPSDDRGSIPLGRRGRDPVPGGGKVEVDVGFDVDAITARFKAVLAHLESLGPVTVAVEPQNRATRRRSKAATGAGDGAEALADTIGETVASGAKRAARSRSKAGAAAGTAGEAVADVAQVFTDTIAAAVAGGAKAATRGGGGGGGGGGLAGMLGGGPQAMAAKVGAIVALIAAAIPVASALVAVVGGLAAQFLAAGAATGIFAVAAIGAFSRAKKAVEDYEKTGNLATGPLGNLVLQFESLKTQYTAFVQATERPVFAVFSRGLEIASHLLTRIEPLIARIAGGIESAMGEIDAAISGVGFADFLAFVGKEAPGAIVNLTKGLIGFAGGLTKLLMQFAPFGRALVQGFADAGAAFNKWAGGLDKNQQFQDFLAYCIAQVPRVFGMIGDLIGAAVRIGVALAPVGGAIVDIIDLVARLVNVLPVDTIAAVFTATVAPLNLVLFLLGKVVDMIGAITGAVPSGGLATVILGAALGPVGAALSMLQGLGISLGGTGKAQDKASAAAKEHAAALAWLGDKAAEAGGKVDAASVKIAQANKLAALSGTGTTAGTGIGGGAARAGVSETMVLPQLAAAAKISHEDLVTGSLGIDPAVQAENLRKMQAYRDQLGAKAKASTDPADKAALEAQALAVDDLIAKYKAASATADEFGAANAAAGDTAADAADGYDDEGNAISGVEKALRKTEKTAAEQRYDAATQAADAYDSAVDANEDAEDALTDAQRRQKRAQEDLTQARRDAAQRIRDVQRALRDMALDERQTALDQKNAQKRLDQLRYFGGSQEEIEQAQIDLERAQNASSDFAQDKGGKKASLEEELKRGVEGNRQLQDAVTASRDASKAVTRASSNVSKAARSLVEAQEAFQSAAGAFGMTEQQLKAFRANMDKVKGKTVKIIANTKDAEASLAKLARMQVEIAVRAGHPDWTPEQIGQEVERQMSAILAATAPAKKTITDSEREANLRKGMAAGGPALPPAAAASSGVSGPTAGAVRGPGSGVSDEVATVLPVGGPARLSNGEHIVTDAEVRAAGGHEAIAQLRAAWLAGLRVGIVDPRPRRFAAGGPATLPALRMPAFRTPTPIAAAGVPAYAAGGAARVAAAASTVVTRSTVVNIGTINNPTAEPASRSIYRNVRRAVDGDDE